MHELGVLTYALRLVDRAAASPCAWRAMPPPQKRHRFHPAGWTAVPDRTACVGCRQCVDTPHSCPMASSLAAGLLFLLRRHWLSFAACLRYNQRYQTK